MAFLQRSSETQRQFLGFLLVGGVAFFIDAGVLQGLVSLAEASPFTARIASFLAAVLFTWVMNHHYTFKADHPLRVSGFVKYISTQSAGLGVNASIYTLCLWLFPITQDYPVIALVPATLVALIFNFVLMKRLVFKSS